MIVKWLPLAYLLQQGEGTTDGVSTGDWGPELTGAGAGTVWNVWPLIENAGTSENA